MTTLQIKRGPSGNLSGITPADGELIYTTDTKELRVGDGTTAGGNPVEAGNPFDQSLNTTDSPSFVTVTANLTGTASNANNSSYLGGNAAADFAQLSGAAFTGNVSGTNISVTGNANAATFTGNLTTPGNGIVKSTSNNITLEGNSIVKSLRILGTADATAVPSSSQSGFNFTNGGTNSILVNAVGQSTADFYGYIIDFTITAGVGTASVITVSTAETYTPITFDATVAGRLVGLRVGVARDTASIVVDESIFPVGTYITAADNVAGTITFSTTATVSTASGSTNGLAFAGPMLSDATKRTYMIIGPQDADNTKIGSVMAIATSRTAGPGTGPYTSAGIDFTTLTTTPSVTWSSNPSFQDPITRRSIRAVNHDTVTNTIMSYNRFGNPVVIGGGTSGVADGYPTITGSYNSPPGWQGLTVVHTGLDTRTEGSGSRPYYGVHIAGHTDNQRSVTATEANAEQYGPQLLFTMRNGNINTPGSDAYARQYRSLGRVAWWTPTVPAGGNLTSDVSNVVNPPAQINVRAETNNNTANVDVGMYLQYSPGSTGAASPRTFLRARQQETTVSGGDKIMFKPLANYNAGTANRLLNSTQAQVWAQASYYTGGNATTEGTGSLFQIRGDRSTSNVALGINRTTGTTASYELMLKSGESALTLYDKTNGANIATFTNANTRFDGNVASYGPLTVRPIGDGSQAAKLNLIQTNGTASNIQIAAQNSASAAGLTFIVETVEKAFFDANDAKYLNSHLNVIRTEALVDAKLKLKREGGTQANFDLIVKSGENRLSVVDANASATIATFDTAKAVFSVPVQFPVYTATAANAITGAAGQQICISNSAQGSNPNGMMAFWDTTHSRWSYIHDNSAV